MKNMGDRLQTYIMQGMMGDEEARDLAIQLCYLGEGELPAICEQWLYSNALQGDMRSRLMYCDLAAVGRIKGAHWELVEQWAREIVKDSPAKGYYILAGVYSEKDSVLANEEKMVECLKAAAAAGNTYAALWLAEYYWYDAPDTVSAKQVRALLEKGLTLAVEERPYSVLIDVCDSMDDYDASMRYLKRWSKDAPKAVEPCMRIALRYLQGKGVRKNEELALKYFEKGAYLGDDDAMFYVGFLNQMGTGCRRNIKRAVEYYVRAVDAGNARACEALGAMYCNGNGVKQDIARGLQYLELGAERGECLSCVNLADMYYHGRGVEQDITHAAEMLDKAAQCLEEDDEVSREALADLREIVEANGWPTTACKVPLVTEEEMLRAIKKNDFADVSYRTLRNMIDEPCNPEVMHHAWFLMQIRVLPEPRLRNYIEVLRDYAESHAELALMVGDMYYHRVGVKRNAASAMLFYSKALENGKQAAAYLRIVLGLHENVLKGGREAVPQWLAEVPAEEADMAAVWYMMGLLYSVGLYVEASADRATELFAKAADAGFKGDPAADLEHWQCGAKSLRDCVLPEKNW